MALLTNSLKSEVWQSTKQSLTSQHGEVIEVIGRENEQKAIEEFIENCIETDSNGTLFIAGAPGCGKSALMRVVVKEFEKGFLLKNENIKLNTLFINCLQLDGIEELKKIVADKRNDINNALNKENHPAKKRRGRSVKSSKAKAHNVETTPSKWLLVVADELDQLRGISSSQMFEDENLIFIGVSNRLDLSDKVAATPRRKSVSTRRQSTIVQTPSFMIGGTILNFKPYTAAQLTDIIKGRLETIDGASALFQPAALMFCAKRVAACSGDARQALDLTRRAMDLACNRSSENSVSMVTVADVAQVVNSVFGSALNDVSVAASSGQTNSANSGPGLPLHERLALVAILNTITSMVNAPIARLSIGGRTPGRRGKNDSTCPLIRVYSTYTSQCREHHIDPLSQSDFADLCGRLADKRLIGVSPPPAKQPLAGPSISLRVTVEEMKAFLEKHSLCNMMLTIDEGES